MDKKTLDQILKYASYGIDILRWFVGVVRTFPVWETSMESNNMDFREMEPTEDNQRAGSPRNG